MLTIPLRHAAEVLVSNVDKKSVDGDVPVRLVNYTDVYYRDAITPDFPLMTATATAEQAAKFRLRAGDSIITKDSETAADIGVPTHVEAAEPDMVSGYHLAIIRSRGETEARFLTWALRSDFVRGQLAVAANGMTRYGLTYDAIRSVDLPCPSREDQQRIADFLDDQIARIDNIITMRREQLRLADDAYTATLISNFDVESTVPMRRYIREAVVGIVVKPAQLYTEGPDGVPALRGLNVRENEIAQENLVRISPDGHREHPRSQLLEGDIVVVRTGDAGAAAVVPDWASGWNCIDLVIVRASQLALPEYLALALNSARRGTTIGAASSGSIQQHFGVGALLDLSVPWRSIEEQRSVATRASKERQELRNIEDRLATSIDLLDELKRSLITAAVTGEFDVSSADGSRVPVRT